MIPTLTGGRRQKALQYIKQKNLKPAFSEFFYLSY